MDTIELNSNHVNKAIKYKILSDEEMKRIGFKKNYYEGTDHEEYSPYWWFTKQLDFRKMHLDISFTVKIPKDGSDIDIMILDEDYLQPVDYQYMLEVDPNNDAAKSIKIQVESWMQHLQDNGVLSGHNYGDYI